MDKIALFDLDKTIISTDSFIEFVIFMIRRNLWKALYLPYLCIIGIMNLLKIVDMNYFKSKWLVFFKGIDKGLMDEISKDFVNKVLLKKIKPGALAEIERLRKEGFALIMATASFGFYVHYLSEYLQFDHLFATDASTDDSGRIITGISGKNCKGSEKIRRILETFDIKDIDKEKSFGYSDSKSDLHYLEITDTFLLVSKKEWKILEERISDRRKICEKH